MIRRIVSSFCVLAVALAASSGARAADNKLKIAVLDLQPRGVDAQLAASTTSLVASELNKLDVFRVISREDIRNMLSFEKDKQSLGCEADQSCLAEIGGALGVEFIVAGSLAKLGDSFVLSLTLNNVKTAQVEGRESQTVQGKQDQLIQVAGRSARALVSKVLKGREGYLIISVVESGALVKIDGQVKGSTPIKGRVTLSWGPHLLEVEKTGFVTYSEDISIQNKQALAKDVSLVPSNDFIDSYEGSARKFRVGAYIASGLMLAGAGTAIGFNVASGRSETAFKNVRDQYNAGNTDPALVARMNDLSNRGTSQVFLSRLGLGVGAAAAALATYFWVAGDDPHKYDSFREVPATPAKADAGSPRPGFAVAAAPLEGGGAQLAVAGRF